MSSVRTCTDSSAPKRRPTTFSAAMIVLHVVRTSAGTPHGNVRQTANRHLTTTPETRYQHESLSATAFLLSHLSHKDSVPWGNGPSTRQHQGLGRSTETRRTATHHHGIPFRMTTATKSEIGQYHIKTHLRRTFAARFLPWHSSGSAGWLLRRLLPNRRPAAGSS